MEDNIFKYGDKVEWSIPVLFGAEAVWTAIYRELTSVEINAPKVNVYGCPACAWAGGRVPTIQSPIDSKIIETIFEYLKSCNATPVFTFTYTGVNKDSLNDSYCNKLLDIALQYDCKFIVYSDLLKDYIKNKSPKAFVTASVIKPTNRFHGINKIEEATPENETNYYNKLLKEYDMVVVRPEYSQTVLLEHPEYIDDISGIEVLINQTCIPNCPKAMEHYRFFERKREGFLYEPEPTPFRCLRKDIPDNVTSYRTNLLHTYNQVTKLVKTYGVKHLKIQGRGEPIPLIDLLYRIYTQIFNTDGSAYNTICNLPNALNQELNYINELHNKINKNYPM